MNNNFTPQPDLNTVDTTETATTGKKMKCFKVKFTKIFQDLTYGIFKEEKLEKLFNIAPQENIEGLEVIKVNEEVWRKIAHKTKIFNVRFQHLQDLILKSLTVVSYMENQLFEKRIEREHAKIKENFKILLKRCADSV